MLKIISISLLIQASVFSVGYAKTPPQAVTSAFHQKFPGIQDVDWELEKNGEWEAGFDGAHGKDMSASFSPDGKWLETETEISFSELPELVQQTLKGKKVKETARIERIGGVILYEAAVKRKDFIFDAAGTLAQ